MRRFPLALALLALLGLLAGGAAVLGAVEAPTGADVAVHNAATATLGASPLRGQYTSSSLGGDVVSFEFSAPSHLTEVAKTPDGTVRARRTVEGGTALAALEPIRDLLSVTGFTGPGPAYVSTMPLSDLLPAGEHENVNGHFRVSVQVSGHYVVAVAWVIRASAAGERLSQDVRYRLTTVGGWESS